MGSFEIERNSIYSEKKFMCASETFNRVYDDFGHINSFKLVIGKNRLLYESLYVTYLEKQCL